MRANEQYGLAAGVLLAVGALLLTFYFAPWRGSIVPGALPPELADEPDLLMQGASITQYQDDGSVQYRLNASEIRHFEDEQFTRLLEPDLELHNQPEPPWRITSERGEIHGTAGAPGGEQVLLRDAVVVHQAGSGSEFMTIRCETLDLYPERKYAETEGDVMIDTDVGRTAARGMQADLTRGSMTLSSGKDAAVHTIVQREQFEETKAPDQPQNSGQGPA